MCQRRIVTGNLNDRFPVPAAAQPPAAPVAA
jgi:hypothetical protein